MNRIDTIRLQLVEISANLRRSRQDLARLKRRVGAAIKPTSKTAREREQELDLLIHEHPDVIALEDTILRQQYQEERAKADLAIAERPFQEHQWFVRQAMADANNDLAASIASCPLHAQTCPQHGLSVIISTATDDRGAFNGTARYLKERSVS